MFNAIPTRTNIVICMYHSSRLSTVTWRKKITVHRVRHR